MLRPQTAAHWDERLVYGMQCALRPVAGALAHRGGLLSFQPEAGRWTLLLSATPARMPTAPAHTIDRLRSLTAYDIQQGLWRRQAHRRHMEAEIPARALLHALSLWLNAPLPAADERPLTPESISIDAMSWEALLYGGESDPVARLLARFPGSVVPPARPAPAPRPPASWLEVNTANPEAVLLLFCPAPARSVPANAAWRLLALLYQPRFFQRLRVDQQIGYIVSCRFYTAAEQDGILFILQSPRCNAAALYAHLLAFLTDMSATLATLPAAELAALNASLTQSLGQPPADNLAQAKADWHEDGRQRHARLVQAATALTPQTLLCSHQRLLRENARWWRLSNQRPPA